MTCSRCGAENPAAARFCNECGSRLAEGADGSRRRVTVLFCDVTGSTELAERLDAEAVHGVMTRFWDEMRIVVERHGGTVEKFIGDAVMAVFGYPLLREDDASRAVRAAGEMRDAMGPLNEELVREWGVSLATRTGVATGEVMAEGASEGTPFISGSIVNLAARLEQAAAPGEILLDAETYRSVRALIDTEPVAPLALKGFADPVRPMRVVAMRSEEGSTRARPPLVDRTTELELLHGAFVACESSGRSRLVSVVGAAGVGKSRLIEEFLGRLEGRATVLVARCPSYGEGPALRPVAEWLGGASGPDVLIARDPAARIADLMPEREAAAAIARLVVGAVGLGSETPAMEEAAWAVRLFVESVARERPLVLLLDDAQWAQPPLIEVVAHVAEWSRSSPILILVLARPELFEAHPGWARMPGTISLTLEPLADTDTERLVRGLLAPKEPAPGLARRISEVAGGNPFFIEEIVATMVEDGTLEQGGEGWVLTRDPGDVAIPSTISAVLAARIDRLSSQERAVLERAAVLGSDATVGDIEALMDEPGAIDVRPMLEALAAKDLLVRGPGPGPAPAGYRFRHELTRAAAYATIPKARRSGLHERVAVLLLDGPDGRDETVGHHLEEAHRLLVEIGSGGTERAADLGSRASEHLARAGRVASARGDAQSSAALLRRAAALRSEGDPERLAILSDLHDALLEAGDPERAGVVVAELLAELGSEDRSLLGERARMQQAVLRFFTDPTAVPIADLRAQLEQAATRFEDTGDDAGLASARSGLALVAWMAGDATAMRREAELAFRLARHAGTGRRAQTEAANLLAGALFRGPLPLGEAAAELEAMIADLSGDRLSIAGLRLYLAAMRSEAGRNAEAREEVAAAQETFRDLGQRRWLANSSDVLAGIAEQEGRFEEAAALRRSVLAFFQEQGDAANALPAAADLAGVLCSLGGLDQAASLAAEVGLEAPEDDIETQVQWRCVRGRALARLGETGAALELATEARDLADRTDFLLLQADARVDLAEVLELAERRDEAADVRAEAAERFRRKGAFGALAHAFRDAGP